jgi:hypothetical protein
MEQQAEQSPRYPAIKTGKNTDPRETIPQGTVKPGRGSLGAHGMLDWDDLVLHTGEARGVADTAYHSLEPDAPTVGAAREGHEIEEDLAVTSELPSSSNAPG